MKSLLIKAALSFAAILLLNACDVVEDLTSEKKDEGTAYIISKDGHNSKTAYLKITAQKIKFTARFDESAVYQTKNPANQADINKLYGFSDCNSDHHTNSARFGWRWYQNRLEIMAYTYKNTVRQEQYISTVDLNKDYEYELECLNNKYIFKLNGKAVEMERGCSNASDKYRLFPYFGGDEVAPHEIKIIIKDLE